MMDRLAVMGRFKSEGKVLATNPDTKMTISTGIDRHNQNRAVAIKSQECSDRRLRDLNTACDCQLKLDHPNINKVLAYYNEMAGKMFKHVIITPLLDSDLNKELRKRQKANSPWSEPTLTYILITLIRALAYCESKDICHRDLKPANLFVNKDGELQIGDFEAVTNAAVLGCSYSVQGTRLYLSPKLRQAIVRGERLIHHPCKSDVYALGVSLLELSLLKSPDIIHPDLAIIEERTQAYLHSLRFSPPFQEVLSAMLIPDEDKRPTFKLLLNLAEEKLCINPEEKVNVYFHAVCQDKNNSGTRLCKACVRMKASCICVCQHPPLVLCEECENGHMNSELAQLFHARLPLSDNSRFDSQSTTNRVRFRLLQKQNFLFHIQSSLYQLNAIKEDIIVAYERRINELQSWMKRELQVVEEANRVVEKMKEMLESRMNFSLYDSGNTVFESLAEITPPYLSCFISNHSDPNPSPIFVHLTKNLSLFEHLADPYSLPLLIPSILSLYRPGLHDSPWHTTPFDSHAEIDSGTSCIFISKAELIICGGKANPHQLTLLNVYTGEAYSLGSTLQPRTYSGVICVDRVIYSFGGLSPGNELTGEKLRLESDFQCERKCADMLEKLYYFTPIEWRSKIYLPGTTVCEYDPVADIHIVRWRAAQIIQFPISSVTLGDILYMFHPSGTTVVNLLGEANNMLEMYTHPKISFFSSPNPVVYQQKAYLFNRFDGKTLQVDLQTLALSESTCSAN